MNSVTLESDNDLGRFRKSVTSGVERCLSRRASHSYRLSLPRLTDDTWRIAVEPTNPGCAPIDLNVCSHDVDLATGYEVCFNIPHDVEIAKNDEAVVAFVADTVEAILSGQLVEEVLQRGSHVYGCRFRLPVRGYVVSQTRVDVARWIRCFWRPKKTTVFRYREYELSRDANGSSGGLPHNA